MISTPDTHSRLVRSGLITATLRVVDGGAVIDAPIFFDEDVVQETGSWFFAIDPEDGEAVADTLTDLYTTLYPEWCARRDAERQSTHDEQPPRRRSGAPFIHTPCPALWAGR